MQKQTADVITLCFKRHEKRRVRRSPAACSCLIVQKTGEFCMCSVHAGCFIFSCCLAPFKCVHTGRWNAACLGIRKGAKWRLWCEKRLRTPQLVVLGICVLLLLPVVLFIAFFLPSIPLIASSSSSPWNKCYCLQPSNCAWPQYKLLFTTIGYISLCCVMCVCVVM